ncbi:Molybdopterin biosynthesis MoaE [Elaphomyces granulatus]
MDSSSLSTSMPLPTSKLPPSTSSLLPPQSSPSLPPHLDPSTYPRTLHLRTRTENIPIHLELTFSRLDPTQLLQQIQSPAAGANVLFVGTTRATFDDRPVARLSYTCYAPLALRTLSRIAHDAVSTYGLCGISIGHRLGTVPVGEASIAVGVSAAHRGPAWRAGEDVLEKCKEKVEIWKREEFVGGGGVWRANRDRDAQGNWFVK